MDADQKQAKHEENMSVHAGEVQTDFTRITGARSAPLVDERQRFVVYNMSHKGIPPVAVDPRKPGLRILRAFPDNESAVSYASEMADKDPTTSLMVAPSASWMLAPPSFDVLGSPEEESATLRQLLDRYRDTMEYQKQEFQQRVQRKEEQLKGTADAEKAAKDPKTQSEPRSRKSQGAARNAARSKAMGGGDSFEAFRDRLEPSDEDKDQQFAVVALATDPASSDELMYAFQFLQSFESEKDADAFVRNTAGPQYKQFDLVVFRCYRWATVNSDSKSISVHYRDEKLDKILQHREDQQQEVNNYRQECHDLNDDGPSTIDIDKEGVEFSNPSVVHRLEDVDEPEPEPEPEPESESGPKRRRSKRQAAQNA